VADTLIYTGETLVTPQGGNSSGESTLDEVHDESLVLTNSDNKKLTLDNDAQMTVALAPLAS
jgi:hypothetical protein